MNGDMNGTAGLRDVLAGQTTKLGLPGGYRTRPPEETLARVRPYLARAGITRLADITGLDCLGIPVTLAVRPNGRVLSVSCGKGITLPAALTSAAMESIELQHAEVEWAPPTVRRSYREMSAEHVVAAVADLPVAKAAPFPLDWPYRWTFGHDIAGGTDAAVPLSMVHMGNRATRIHDLWSFQVTSNGLASGNTLVEAIYAGLLEVVERDSVTVHVERRRRGTPGPPLVDLAATDFPLVHELLGRVARAGATAVLFDCTTDVGIPVYMANLLDPDGQVAGVFAGYGASLDPQVAMTRAITEAAQARTVTIAGSRDDLHRHRAVRGEIATRYAPTYLAGLAELPPAPPPTPAPPTLTFEQDVRHILDRLDAVGLRQVVVLDLSTRWCPVSVVKVVVPGLEGYQGENYAPGRRARVLTGGAA